MLITYGLRAGEVAGLRLEDLDWEEEVLRGRCPKPGWTYLYPLSRGVGNQRVHYDVSLSVAGAHPGRDRDADNEMATGC